MTTSRIVLADSRPTVTNVTLTRGSDGDSLYRLNPHRITERASRITLPTDPSTPTVSTGNTNTIPSTHRTRRHNRG